MAARPPVRSCLGCGQKRPQAELFRVALDDAGTVVVDAARRRPGRGGYLCGPGCLQAAVKRKAFQRTFRGKVKQLDADCLGAGLRALRVEG